jgi:peroxiredoxin
VKASTPVITENTTKVETGTEIGMHAPDFVLNKIDGTPVKLSEYKGKTVLLDFWISTCPSCKKKLGILQEFYGKTSRETIEVLGINVQEYESWAARFAESQKLTMPILLDTEGAVTRLYKVKGLPALVIIDAGGNIYKKDVNFDSLEELEMSLP